MSILVTGGTGYIGSHTVVVLLEAGYDVIIADNLYNSKLDVLDKIETITGIRPMFYNVDVAKRYNYEYLLVNFLDKEGGEQTLYEEAKEDIMGLCQKEYRGSTIQKQAVNKLNACVKRINEFKIETKNLKLEADLVLYALELQFANPAKVFGARVSGYDYKVGLLLKRLITLVSKKLHPDYLVDYQDKINEFLTKLHKTSNRINTIKELPEKIE
jgi:hypothetical protein